MTRGSSPTPTSQLQVSSAWMKSIRPADEGQPADGGLPSAGHEWCDALPSGAYAVDDLRRMFAAVLARPATSRTAAPTSHPPRYGSLHVLHAGGWMARRMRLRPPIPVKRPVPMTTRWRDTSTPTTTTPATATPRTPTKKKSKAADAPRSAPSVQNPEREIVMATMFHTSCVPRREHNCPPCSSHSSGSRSHCPARIRGCSNSTSTSWSASRTGCS